MPTGKINPGKTEQVKFNSAVYSRNIEAKTSTAQQDALLKKAMDTDHDGKVTVAEQNSFQLRMTAAYLKSPASVDRNGDGQIGFSEQLAFALDHGDITTKQVNDLVARDTNKDGVVSKQEAMSAAVREVAKKLA